MSTIWVKKDFLDKCFKLCELREDTDEIRDLCEVNQALFSFNSTYFIYVQNLIYRMEQKYAKEIDVLENIASNFSSINASGSLVEEDNTSDDPTYNALLRIQFAICLKICLKKCFIKYAEEFIDINQYK